MFYQAFLIPSGVIFPSYSVKPKSIDFTGFDDFYFTSNKSRE